MPHEHSQAEAIIRRLIEAKVDAPSQVRVKPILPEESRDANARFVKWSVGVAGGDFGKLVGKLGSHRKALMLVVEAMGAQSDADWCLVVEPPTGPKVRKPAIARAETFDAVPLRKLLSETLEHVFDQHADITATQSCEFVGAIILVSMKIDADSRADRALLTEPCEVEGEALTLLEAFRTLFRAIGRQQGVAVKIEEAT